jgi:hypothetical protein
MNMKTIWRIPYQRAPVDPSWLLKKKAGRKLDPIEVEEYFRYKFEQSYKAFLRETGFRGVPSDAAISKAIQEYHYFKKDCLTSFLYCGIAYNK